MCEAIHKYQLEEGASQDKLTSEKFENMLCEVVRDVEAREVHTYELILIADQCLYVRSLHI
jgi:hypothetical protein